MRKVFIVILFMSFYFVSNVNAQYISKENAKADLKFCYDALKATHPSIYRYTKEEEYNNIYKFMEARIPDSIHVNDLLEIVNDFVSTARCAHTTVSTKYKAKSTLVFNNTFVIHNNKLYGRGIKEYSNDTGLVRIISINKIPAIEIVDRMLMLKTGDGYSQSFTEALMSKYFNAYFNALFTCPDICPMVLQTPSGEKEILVNREKKLTAKYKDYDWEGSVVLDTMASVKFMKMKNIPDTRILKLTSFKKKNNTFYTKIFDSMRKDSVKQLVIDLRSNTGGNIYHAFFLLNNIIDQDIYMYSERRNSKSLQYFSSKGKVQYLLGKLLYDVIPNGQRWKDENGMKYYRYEYKTLNKDKFKPKVFVITDGITVSSASLVAAYLKYYADATIVGTETGGTYTGNNGRSFANVELPNSKITFRIPLFYINYFPGVPNYGRGVQADVFLSPILDKKSVEIQIQDQLLD